MNDFVVSEQILNVIAMAKLYDTRPSNILNIPDEYTCYCFDETCAYIVSKIENKEEPNFEVLDTDVEKVHYSSLSSMYESMGYKNGGYVKSLM